MVARVRNLKWIRQNREKLHKRMDAVKKCTGTDYGNNRSGRKSIKLKVTAKWPGERLIDVSCPQKNRYADNLTYKLMECFGVFLFMTLHLSFISLLTHWNAFDKSRNIASGTKIKVTSVFIGYSPEYKSPPATQQVVDCMARKMLPIVRGLYSTLVYIQYAEGACVCIGLHSCADMVLKSKSKPFFSKK